MARAAILAHRGGPEGRYPENSIAAARAAQRLGIAGIEIDLRLSRDGVFFVHHDEAIPRLGRIRDLPASRLKRRLESLVEFLGRVTTGDVYLDVKDVCPPRELFRQVPLAEDRIIVGSLWHPFIREVKQLRRNVRTAVTVEARLVRPARAARAARADILAIEKTYVDRATVLDARRAGVGVFVWTVDKPADLRRFETLGCAGVFTDFPARLSEIRVSSKDPDGD